jgi:hypothetical protein
VAGRTDDHARPDLAVAVFARDEGARLHGSLLAVNRAAEAAAAAGWSVERLLILRGRDAATAAWIEERAGLPWHILRQDDERLGHARNALFGGTRARYLAMLDGGDLCSANWLAAALRTADATPYAAVWHTEIVIRFGGEYFSSMGYSTFFHPDAVAFTYDYASMLANKAYHGGCFLPRAIAEAVPYPIEDPARGWGDVDWWWQCNVVGSGFHHRVLTHTFHYQRVDQNGVPPKLRDLPAGTRIGPTPLMRGPLPAMPG